ncbi:MAG TPA: sulfatase-like hydrolase/transferase [Vicinamibacterales bacterium]|nr:sulfatase-like hydrolase/transferase [Vicinamibacterales bacterium]
MTRFNVSARSAAVAVFVAIGLGALATFLLNRSAPRLARGTCRGCNVLLVTIDTLRYDRVGAFGGRPGLTPNIDRLASEGLRLTRAYTAAPLTLPAHASILTGVSPPVHGLRANGLFRLGPAPPTLATVLKDTGYRTGAFVGAFVLDARFGLNRGFDVYDDRYGEKHEGDTAEGAERRAEEVVKPALAWILAGGSGSPWFAWVHLYDPHAPYRAPEPFASQHEPYDAEVAYADAMIGRLLDALRAAGQLERTLVVMTADHGESLGEHGERTHGVFTYDVTMRVPWFFWAARRISSAAFDGLSRLVDLTPTVVDLVGADPRPEFEGRSLVAAVNARDTAGSAYFEAMDANLTRNWAPLTGIVSGGYKMIDLPLPELYDVSADPSEATNLFAREPERARTLEALLRNAVAGFAARGSSGQKTTLSAESRQRLQALGYVASAAEPGQRVYTDADDPKTLIGPSNDLEKAVLAFNAGERAGAMARVRSIARQHPQFTTAYGILASMQRGSGDLPGGIATLEDIVRRGIADPSVMVVLAGYLQEAGALDKAVGVLEAVTASRPDYAEAYNSLGVAYLRMGRHDRARAALQKVIELDPTSARAYENLGADKIAAGELAAAIPDLRRAIDLDPMLYDALYNLAMALETLGQREEARPLIERFVREAPPARYGSDIARLKTVLGQ